jgi:hypothetical protein
MPADCPATLYKIVQSETCVSDNSITDCCGDTCATYHDKNKLIDRCGDYDAGAFEANIMCCSCGGGTPVIQGAEVFTFSGVDLIDT